MNKITDMGITIMPITKFPTIVPGSVFDRYEDSHLATNGAHLAIPMAAHIPITKSNNVISLILIGASYFKAINANPQPNVINPKGNGYMLSTLNPGIGPANKQYIPIKNGIQKTFRQINTASFTGASS